MRRGPDVGYEWVIQGGVYSRRLMSKGIKVSYYCQFLPLSKLSSFLFQQNQIVTFFHLLDFLVLFIYLLVLKNSDRCANVDSLITLIR